MNAIKFLLLTGLLLTASAACAEKILIAAAADLKFALDEIAAEFRQDHPDDTIEIVYGSSGKFFTQIQQDAPYDLYFSADIGFPKQLAQDDFAASEVKPYAVGRIVLWSATLDASMLTLENLTDSSIKRIAIANPKHAPYGKRAEEALRSTGIWAAVEPKLVYGENIAHTAQFVQTGNAQTGIIALSLALNPELSKQGGHYLIPDTLHEPLEQGYIITRRAANNVLAKNFAEFIASPQARNVMTRYGFILPDQIGNP
ncbi:molybdate ABC transporter substrate-binding protein [Methylotuvimicrobium alcaliphilum]|uniref:ABC transporter, periplasmic protein molybdate transporter n=1 Tax=Methylotuvimicrobium alcaliphilum (strain DSM 19304 / NCIMB 14124 / VKM B-2133 / 20Z) TaxID=1091494 RepID=G4SUZ9_META2|nr:molybdate ABC transporter substrate-binding protein [Methylotuvimicrobium alcaliphilum]CCE24058.1 ABC transporter, periplasmic protein; molybdate transporter [Methylotuvimicrobium alcaliphilum 20Z]